MLLTLACGEGGLTQSDAEARAPTPPDAQTTDVSVDAGPDAAPVRDAARPDPDASAEVSDASPPDARPDAAAPGCALVPGLQTIRFAEGRSARVLRPAAPAGPLLIDLHGRGGTAETHALLSNFDALAEAEGFTLVQPQGAGGDNTWNAGLCCGGAQTGPVDDVGAIAALLDSLAPCFDPARVYATGISNGAFMAHRLACELAERIAGIGPVAGGNLMLACQPSRPVPVLQFHGTADAIVPFEGFAGFVSIPDSTAGWVARNGCDPSPQVVFEEADVRCERWTGCEGGASVQLCVIEEGGHTWPGGPAIPGLGHTTQTISASRMMWDFFTAQER